MSENIKANKVYPMKTSINLWAFPYPNTVDGLKKSFELAKKAKWDGVEINFDEKGAISMEATDDDLKKIADMKKEIGVEFGGMCTFLFWKYPPTSPDPKVREKIVPITKRMINACEILGVQSLLVVPGAVYIPWEPEMPEVGFQDAWDRATSAIKEYLPLAEEKGITLSIENIGSNGFLMGPREVKDFVDQFNSKFLGVHFDTANVGSSQFPEDWIRYLGKRITNVHIKEFNRAEASFPILEAVRMLGDGSVNWPAVIDALDSIGYKGYLNFEYYHPYKYYPEALLFHASDYLHRILGRQPLYG
ncbi:sugar phosphate isomerase/epimerase family protein [[Eubacterium] cellulosolvens]